VSQVFLRGGIANKFNSVTYSVLAQICYFPVAETTFNSLKIAY
jgi:hypothetical protein